MVDVCINWKKVLEKVLTPDILYDIIQSVDKATKERMVNIWVTER